MINITNNIRRYFEKHTKVNELFFTNDHLGDNGGDQLAFFTAESADAHANNLADKIVTRITRADAYATFPNDTPVETLSPSVVVGADIRSAAGSRKGSSRV